MRKLEVRFHPDAVEEVDRARDWYRQRNPVAGAAFVLELDRAVTHIQEAPERWPRFTPTTRRFVLPRFPFDVIYRAHGRHLEVVAVAHHKRRPGYWRAR